MVLLSELPTYPCPVCQTADVLPIVNDQGDSRTCPCPTCGPFVISGTMLGIFLEDWTKNRLRLRAGLSAYIRQQNKLGEKPRFASHVKLAQLAEGHCHTSVETKLRRVLE